jgi:hypothetical protein
MNATVQPLNISDINVSNPTKPIATESLFDILGNHFNDISIKLSKDENKFEVGVLMSKFGMLFGLLIVSFINADVMFINKEPRKFLTECSLVGGTAIASSILLGTMRKSSLKTILNGAFIAFLVFFIFHLLMEMSGMNNYETQDKNTGDEAQQEWLKSHVFSNYTKFLLLAGAIPMFYIAFKVNDFSVAKTHGKFTNSGIAKLLFECLVFGLINSSPAIFITKNRGFELKEALHSFGVGTALYSSLYLLLEAGGFWTNAFSNESHIKLHVD